MEQGASVASFGRITLGFPATKQLSAICQFINQFRLRLNAHGSRKIGTPDNRAQDSWALDSWARGPAFDRSFFMRPQSLKYRGSGLLSISISFNFNFILCLLLLFVFHFIEEASNGWSLLFDKMKLRNITEMHLMPDSAMLDYF